MAKCANKIKAFVTFLVEKRDLLSTNLLSKKVVKRYIDTAIKIHEDQKIPVEKRRVRRKKRITAESAEEFGLIVFEEVRRCVFEALNRFKLKQKKHSKN